MFGTLGYIHDTEYHYHVSTAMDFLNESVKLLKPKDSCSECSFFLVIPYRAFLYW